MTHPGDMRALRTLAVAAVATLVPGLALGHTPAGADADVSGAGPGARGPAPVAAVVGTAAPGVASGGRAFVRLRSPRASAGVRRLAVRVAWHLPTLRVAGRHALTVRLVAVGNGGRPRVLAAVRPAPAHLRSGTGKVVLRLNARQARKARRAARAAGVWLTATQRFDRSGDADSLYESAYVTTRALRVGAKARRAGTAAATSRNCSGTAAGAAGALDGCRLVGADLARVDLSHTNFTGADLRAVRLRGANVTGTAFTGASLDGTGLGAAVENPTGMLQVTSGAAVPAGTRVVVFQPGLDDGNPVAWQVLSAAQPGGAVSLAVPGSLYLRIMDDFGNFSPALPVQGGQEWTLGRSPLGIQPSLAGAAGNGAAIHVTSRLQSGATAQLLRGGAVVAEQQLLPGGSAASFQPSSAYTAAVMEGVAAGDVLNSAVVDALAGGQRQFTVRPGESAALELVMASDGSGPVLQ